MSSYEADLLATITNREDGYASFPATGDIAAVVRQNADKFGLGDSYLDRATRDGTMNAHSRVVSKFLSLLVEKNVAFDDRSEDWKVHHAADQIVSAANVQAVAARRAQTAEAHARLIAAIKTDVRDGAKSLDYEAAMQTAIAEEAQSPAHEIYNAHSRLLDAVARICDTIAASEDSAAMHDAIVAYKTRIATIETAFTHATERATSIFGAAVAHLRFPYGPGEAQ